jgi:hypothetical protein
MPKFSSGALPTGAGFERAASGRGVVDGKLIEKPVLRSMRRILAIARRLADER